MKKPDNAATDSYFEQRRLFGGEGTSIRAYPAANTLPCRQAIPLHRFGVAAN
jgi:hypothetical protein